VFCYVFNIALLKKTEYYSSKKMLEFILFAEAKHKTHGSTSLPGTGITIYHNFV